MTPIPLQPIFDPSRWVADIVRGITADIYDGIQNLNGRFETIWFKLPVPGEPAKPQTWTTPVGGEAIESMFVVSAEMYYVFVGFAALITGAATIYHLSNRQTPLGRTHRLA